MISVGGWTYRHVSSIRLLPSRSVSMKLIPRQAFASLPDAAWRAEFVRSSVKLVVDLGLDGIDIDYEWSVPPCPLPFQCLENTKLIQDRADAKTKEGTAELMVELRRGLDEAAAQIGAEKLLLSVSVLSTEQTVKVLIRQYAAPCGSAWDFLDIPKMDAVSVAPIISDAFGVVDADRCGRTLISGT